MSRQQRRALERQQSKANRKLQKQTPITAGQSTGPRTLEGKAVSSQNALHHGLTATRLVLPWESQADFDHLLNELISEHRAATITEQILVREIAESYWRLMRARNQEHRVLSATPDPAAEAAWEKSVMLAQRYVTRFERSFHKSLALLRTLQKERRIREAEAEAEAGLESEPIAVPGQFVSQKRESAALAEFSDPSSSLANADSEGLTAGV